MKAKITLNIHHSKTPIAVISKTIEVPNVYGNSGIETSLSLAAGFKFTSELSTSHVDLDTGLVCLGSPYAINLTHQLEKAAIPKFLQSIEEFDWTVDEKKEAIANLVSTNPIDIDNNKVIPEKKRKFLSLFFNRGKN